MFRNELKNSRSIDACSSEGFVKTGIVGLDNLVKGFPRGGLIVVKGNPGVGKTAFASSFIYNGITKLNEPGVYASFIEEENSFYQYMNEFGYDLRVFRDKKMFRYLSIPTLLEPGIASFMDFTVEAIEEIDAKRLVIDSFTVINQLFKSDVEARAFLHTLFSKIVKSLGCTTVLIKEESSATGRGDFSYEEFIADSVISLKVDRIEDKFIREMSIVKMRGNIVESPDNCFTLYKGFQVLTETKFPKIIKPVRMTPLPDTELSYSTGLSELDDLIGGYGKGSTIFLEINPKVTKEQYRLIVWVCPANFIVKGRPMITLPGMGSTMRDIDLFNDTFSISEEERTKLTKCFLPKTAVEAPRKYVVTYDPVEGIDSLINNLEEAAERLYQINGNPPIIILSIDSLVFNYPYNDVLRLLSRISTWTRKKNALLLLLDKSSHPELTVKLSSIASVHFKLLRKHGCLMFFGVKPRTPLYAVQTNKETPIPKLIPIV